MKKFWRRFKYNMQRHTVKTLRLLHMWFGRTLWALAQKWTPMTRNYDTAFQWELLTGVPLPDHIMEKYEAERYREWQHNKGTLKFVPFSELRNYRK